MSDGTITCPGCGEVLSDKEMGSSKNYNASAACEELFNELSGHTLSMVYTNFIHQYVVDAYGAQHAGPPTKNIRVIFSLIGLCLAVEHNYTGRQVQLVHMKIPKQNWPELEPPEQPADVTVAAVLSCTTEQEKVSMIKNWAASVWESWWKYHDYIREMATEYT